MPYNFNDNLDDELVHDGQVEWTGGVSPLRTQVSNTAEGLKNLWINPKGRIQTRPGSTNVNSNIGQTTTVLGMCYYDIPTAESLVAVANRCVYSWNGTGTIWSNLSATPGGYNTNASATVVDIVQGVDTLYIADGYSNLHTYNGTAFTDITSTTNAAGGAPPVPSHLLWYMFRLFAVQNSAKDTIWVSNILNANATSWPSDTCTIRVGAGEGDDIVGLAGLPGSYLAVLKRNSTWSITCDTRGQDDLSDPVNWNVKRISQNIGCIARRSIVQVGNDVLFLSRDGVRALSKTDVEGEFSASSPVSVNADEYFDRVNWDYADKSAAVFVDGLYILAVPADSSTTVNVCFVLDTRRNCWLGEWSGTGFTPSCWAHTQFSGLKRVYFGNTVGQVVRFLVHDSLQGSIYTDQGSNIATEIVTKRYFFGEPTSRKKGNHIEIRLFNSDAIVTATPIFDEERNDAAAWTIDSGSSGLRFPITFPFTVPTAQTVRDKHDLLKFDDFNEMQLKLATTAEKVSYEAIFLSAFLNAIESE